MNKEKFSRVGAPAVSRLNKMLTNVKGNYVLAARSWYNYTFILLHSTPPKSRFLKDYSTKNNKMQWNSLKNSAKIEKNATFAGKAEIGEIL